MDDNYLTTSEVNAVHAFFLVPQYMCHRSTGRRGSIDSSLLYKPTNTVIFLIFLVTLAIQCVSTFPTEYVTIFDVTRCATAVEILVSEY